MKFVKHIGTQPFIVSTGAAALIHSTWSLGTLFAGTQPDATTDPLAFAGWLIPALLIAFALDVGQIATSAEIREGQRTAWKYATFAVFAVATYFLQWLYMAHHMPSLDLGAGVRGDWQDAAKLFRDLALWAIPALLPLSTLLYTFSTGEPKQAQQPESVTISEPVKADLTVPALASGEPQLTVVPQSESVTEITVEDQPKMEAKITAAKLPRVTRKKHGAVRVNPNRVTVVNHCKYEKCGKAFETTNPRKMYCSDSHRVLAGKKA